MRAPSHLRLNAHTIVVAAFIVGGALAVAHIYKSRWLSTNITRWNPASEQQFSFSAVGVSPDAEVFIFHPYTPSTFIVQRTKLPQHYFDGSNIELRENINLVVITRKESLVTTEEIPRSRVDFNLRGRDQFTPTEPWTFERPDGRIISLSPKRP